MGTSTRARTQELSWETCRTVFICLAFGLVGYWFTCTVAQTIIAEDAKNEARRWSNYLAASQSDMTSMLEGMRPSTEMQDTLLHASDFASMEEISIHRLDGKQTFHRRSVEKQPDEDHSPIVPPPVEVELEEEINLLERFPQLNPGSKSSMKSMPREAEEAIVRVREADDETEEGLETEIVIPLYVGKEVAGYALLELDLTERWNVLVDAIRPISFLCALLFALCPLGFIYVLKRNKQSISNLAAALATDPLTGIGSRQALYDLEFELNRNGKGVEDGTTIAFLDVDKFKFFNDNFGHEFGDEVLKAIGQHAVDLQSKYPSLKAFRLGGDEFVMVLQGLKTNAEAMALADEIQQVTFMSDSMTGNKVTCSIGVFRQDDSNTGVHLFERALARADAALYAGKAKGGNVNTLFDAAMDQEWEQQKAITVMLSESDKTSPFVLHYQPYFDMQSNALKGFEALLRMRGTDGKLVPPDKFIPLAERNGSIETIGARALIAACMEASRWPTDIKISVNISPVQFRSGNLVAHIRTALSLASLNAKQLEIEITESLLMEDFSYVTSQLEDIKALGVSIALDDFGTGYSSLSYLWRFPFDKLKIDKSFVQKLEHEEGAFKILATIVDLAQQLGFESTAEGIETEKQHHTLRELGCTLGQGYLFHKPVEDEQARIIILKAQAEAAKTATADTNLNKVLVQDLSFPLQLEVS